MIVIDASTSRFIGLGILAALAFAVGFIFGGE